jgi:high-affinity iron transporter
VLGLAVAVLLGWLLARGAVRLDLRRFFAWTGGFLVVVAAGVLAYAFHDLQEAGAFPGPFSDAATIDPVTGGVGVGVAGFPFGWAFDLSAQLPPGSAIAALLQATVGFMPEMTWLQVIAWGLYLAVVGTFFVRGLFPRPRPAPAASADTSASRHASQGAS